MSRFVRRAFLASRFAHTRFGKPPSGGPSFSKVLLEHLVVLYPQYAENTVFLIFADGFHDSDHFIGYSFGISRNKVSTVFYGTAFPKRPQCPFPRRQAGLCKKAAGNRCCWLAGSQSLWGEGLSASAPPCYPKENFMKENPVPEKHRAMCAALKRKAVS